MDDFDLLLPHALHDDRTQSQPEVDLDSVGPLLLVHLEWAIQQRVCES